MVTRNRPRRDLKAALVLKGITQTELARRIHRSRQYLSELLNGHRPIPPDVAKLISFSTGISLAAIQPDGYLPEREEVKA
ncbi:hypothetical protein LCGC14_2094010 [marine sediment metagenome]|uniref:HTH cro/C1-type domain-containing protein n=1 Tax=marine sediment metagenome TaxID=412755 RepID=A0A0F9EC41_9ZZZZ